MRPGYGDVASRTRAFRYRGVAELNNREANELTRGSTWPAAAREGGPQGLRHLSCCHAVARLGRHSHRMLPDEIGRRPNAAYNRIWNVHLHAALYARLHPVRSTMVKTAIQTRVRPRVGVERAVACGATGQRPVGAQRPWARLFCFDRRGGGVPAAGKSAVRSSANRVVLRHVSE